MLRILYTASTYSHMVQFHRPYLRAFRELGWTVDVACGGAPMDIPEANHVIHISFEKQMFSPRNGIALRQLHEQMRKVPYDVVSCHTSLAAFFTRMATYGLTPRPFVVCVSHGYLFGEHSSMVKNLVLSTAERLVAPVTDYLMTMNQWDKEYAAKHKLGKHMANIHGIGLDPERMGVSSAQEGQALREAWGIAPEDVLLLYAAEFSQRKRQAHLIRALTLLPQRVKLALPGQGALLEECQKLALELGVEHRVLFPGQIPHMAPWYQAADIGVSSSRSEGLPFNILEAMYHGLPIVASDVKGNRDLLAHPQTGLCYPYGDWRACAAQIQSLLDNPAKALELGTLAKQRVQPYLLEHVLPEVMKRYGYEVAVNIGVGASP